MASVGQRLASPSFASAWRSSSNNIVLATLRSVFLEGCACWLYAVRESFVLPLMIPERLHVLFAQPGVSKAMSGSGCCAISVKVPSPVLQLILASRRHSDFGNQVPSFKTAEASLLLNRWSPILSSGCSLQNVLWDVSTSCFGCIAERQQGLA